MLKINRFFLVLVLILDLISISFAQEEAPEPSKWAGDVSLGLSLNRGNADNSNISFTFNLNGQMSEKIAWVNNALFLFGKAGEITNTETYQLGTRLNWQHTDRFFSYYEIQGIRDQFKNYDYRILPGLGVGYKFINQEKLLFAANAGLAEVFTKYYDSGETDSYLGVTIAQNFAWKFSESAEINQKWEWNFNTSELSHYLSYFEGNLISNLIKNWSIKLTVINRHDSNPIGEGIKKNDFSFLAGISTKF